MTSPLKLREKVPDRVKFGRSQLPGLAEELEEIYNFMATHNKPPSERFYTLIRWVRQEAEVLKDPEYDPTFTCTSCGFGSS